jgi:hypothetical protein
MAGVGSVGCLVRSPVNGRFCVLAETADGISTIGGRIGDRADIDLLRKR